MKMRHECHNHRPWGLMGGIVAKIGGLLYIVQKETHVWAPIAMEQNWVLMYQHIVASIVDLVYYTYGTL